MWRRLLFVLTLGALPTATLEARPPNVIFILADDLGYGDLGCFGQKLIRTPNLDRMAEEGMKLTQHYSGNAVCAPSRCVLMTGYHPGYAVVRNNRSTSGVRFVSGEPEAEGQFPLPKGTVTLASVFQQAGYATGGFGKWGLGGPGSTGEPLAQGFDRWFGYNCQAVAHNFYPTYLWDDRNTIPLDNPAFSAHDGLREDEDPADPASYERFKGNEYSADLIGQAALEFIQKNKDQPFFLYWPTTVPHVALQVPEDSLDEYEGRFDDPPYPGGKGYIPHFKPRAAYAGMITRMDRDIGRMMELVEHLGLDDETVFVFTSDNGPLNGTHEGLAGTDCVLFNSNDGLRDGKGTLYEGGIRVPTIVRWKGIIAPGSESDWISGFEDWLPTLVHLAGIDAKLPSDLNGMDFSAALHGETLPVRPFLYREFPGYKGQQSIRVGPWKAIRRNLLAKEGGIHTALYHLGRDRAETTDVSTKHPEVVRRLEKLMASQHQDSEDFPFPALDAR